MIQHLNISSHSSNCGQHLLKLLLCISVVVVLNEAEVLVVDEVDVLDFAEAIKKSFDVILSANSQNNHSRKHQSAFIKRI